ncbi:MAG TPA: AMP-binding protein [Acidimicrobiales bacterium]|nr:AMP-binding protein [Acidimicrobiales bacterium]
MTRAGSDAAATPSVEADGAGLPRLSVRIAGVLALEPSAPALEFERRWYRWGELGAAADAIAPHVGAGERVAVLLRNRPAHVGLLLGLLRRGACAVTANPERGVDRVGADLASLGVGTFAGEPADLEAFAPPGRWLASDALGALQVSGTGDERTEGRPGVAVEMLTSGTTGPPKRVPLTYDTLLRVLAGAKYYERNPDADLRLRSGVVIVNSPLVHLGGLFRVLQCVNDGRAFCLLERFRVDEWSDAVRRHRPLTVSLVPAALRMVLEAGPDPADLASVRSVVSGTAPLAPEDADAFFARYGVPVLVSYAATEFGGAVAGWNLADHGRFWSAKRGSVGRAHPGCELRVVDAGNGATLAPDEEGLLEVRTRLLGDDAGWVRTTDVARIDADGFVYILGRADQAIIRGGFKVRPEDVRAALERDPRVRGAAVVGRPDPRLGAVPVAAVELRPGAVPFPADELVAGASKVLARYELPDEVRFVDALPRTPAGKVDLAAVRDLFTAEPA